MANIGVKIISKNDIAKSIKIVRKYSNSSISEIKDFITNNKYVIEGHSHKTEDIVCIKKIYTELCNNKIETKLFVNDKEITEKIFTNIIESHYLIKRQTREMMNQEADE